MGKNSCDICVIDICHNDTQYPELHTKHGNVNGDAIMQIL